MTAPGSLPLHAFVEDNQPRRVEGITGSISMPLITYASHTPLRTRTSTGSPPKETPSTLIIGSPA